MLILKNVSWVQFKWYILLIDESMESNSHLVDCGRFIDDLECDLMNGNDHVFAREIDDNVEWNRDNHYLLYWCELLIELMDGIGMDNYYHMGGYDKLRLESIINQISKYLNGGNDNV